MALAESGLSLAALALRQALFAAQVLPQESSIIVGHPSAAQTASAGGEAHFLNLFFYRVEPGAYRADAGVDDPFYLRLFCLITPYSKDEPGESPQVPSGESDLRLIGNVLTCFHEHPLLLLRSGATDLATLQVVPTPLTLEAMNNLWSTQKDVPYRLSVAYELALVPAQASPPRPAQSPLVIEIALRELDSPVLSLTPEIAFVDADGARSQVLVTTVGQTPLELGLAGRGSAGDRLQLAWSRWPGGGTRPRFEPVSPPLIATLALTPDFGTPVSASIDRTSPGQLLITASELVSADGSRHNPEVNRLIVAIRPKEQA